MTARQQLLRDGFIKKPDAKKFLGVAATFRGFHAGSLPVANHIGKEIRVNPEQVKALTEAGYGRSIKGGRGGGNVLKIREDDQAWVEVLVPDNSHGTNWQEIAESRAGVYPNNAENRKLDRVGKIKNNEADINDQIPFAGHYTYRQGAASKEESWVISGNMLVTRRLSRDEVNRINRENGINDAPTMAEVSEILGDQDVDRVNEDQAPKDEAAPKLSKRTLSINVPNVDSRDVDRISQRLPLGATATEDGVAENLRLTLDDLLSNERLTAKAAELIRNYNIITEQEAETLTDEQIIEVLTDRLADNLVFVYDSVDPQTRERSKLWYVGANRIANEIAQKYGVPVSSVAGVMAALSPQKDWYQNVSLAERLIDIKTTKMDMVPTKEMLATANRIFGKAQYQPMLNVIFRQGRNMPLSEYADAPLLEAMFIRIYDETYNDRGYNIVSPDGEDLGFSRKKDGTKSNVAWGSNVEISKAVRALNDPESVALEMGERHKVRNFYNNIVAPNSLDGDVTSDTHAVAAAHMKPLSGKSTEVHHNFGTAPTKAQQDKLPDWRGAMSNSKPTGVMGTYVIYAEAHRRAAERRGTLPREMQSITWEAVRGLFLPSFKANANNVQKIDDIWNNYRKGLIDIDQVRQEVMNEAGDQGRFRPPSWEGPDSGSLKSAELAIDESELSGAIVSRRTPRDYGRVGGEPARGNPRDIDEPSFGNLSEKQIDDLAETRDVFESLPKYSKRSAPAPAILGAPDQEARARTGLPIINRFSTVSAPVRFPDKRFSRYESLFGVIMDGNKPVPVLLFAGEHNNETNGGFGLSHILERNHEIELKDNSKFPDIETAIQQTFFAWAKQGHQDGPRVVSSVGTAGGDKARSVDGVFRSMSKKDLVLDWVDPSHKSKAPFRIVLNYGIVSDPDVKAEFGFKNDIPVYSITTAYPVLALKDRANVRQSKRSVTVMPIDYRPPSYRPITAMVEENEEAYQRITYNNVAKVLGNISGKFVSDEKADRIQARSERFLTKFQDAMLPIGKMMDELRSDGYSVADGLDTYMREELSHGVIGYKLDENRRNLFDPLAQSINAIDVGQSNIDRLTGGATRSRCSWLTRLGRTDLSLALPTHICTHFTPKNVTGLCKRGLAVAWVPACLMSRQTTSSTGFSLLM